MSDTSGVDPAAAPEDDDTNADAQGAIPTSSPDTGGDGDVTGSVPDNSGQTGAAGPPAYDQEGPNTPEMEALNTREKALDKSGLGGAFGAAQRKQITDQRMALVQQLIQHGLQSQAGGPGGPPQAGPNNRPDPNAGAIPTSDQDQDQGDQQPDAGPLGNEVRSIGQKIGQKIGQAASGYAAGWQRLLSGQGAMDHKTAEVVQGSVNKDGSNATPSLDALQKVTERGGPDAGVAFMQNRVGVYNAARAWAAAAYDGKDLTASVGAANRAFSALPMAEQVKFSTGDNGTVTATVSAPNEGDQPISYKLPSANFRELMRGNSGFAYDILMQGPNQVLSKLAGEDHGAGADPNSQGVAPGPNGPVTDTLKALGVNQAEYNLGFSLYPWASQAAQRNQWFAGQVQEKSNQGHQLAVAKQQGINRQAVAETQAGGRQAVATQHEAAATGRSQQHEEAATGRTQIRADKDRDALAARVKMNRDNIVARSKIADKNIAGRQVDTVIRGLEAGTMSEEDADTMFKKHGTSLDEILGTGKPQGNASVGQPAPKAGAASAPPPGAPQVGTVKGGYQFNGGDPSDQNSWSKVQ